MFRGGGRMHLDPGILGEGTQALRSSLFFWPDASWLFPLQQLRFTADMKTSPSLSFLQPSKGVLLAGTWGQTHHAGGAPRAPCSQWQVVILSLLSKKLSSLHQLDTRLSLGAELWCPSDLSQTGRQKRLLLQQELSRWKVKNIPVFFTWWLKTVSMTWPGRRWMLSWTLPVCLSSWDGALPHAELW